ncbi:MAG: malectin domain-containing carbohydrate-binding protein [Acidobacteriota bacterium]
MKGLDPIQQQKAELETVLASDAFRRAPNLSRLLRFLCEKHWEGTSGEIKEYTLAVDVLGRPADFDPLTNSIVRVELHRLREKLKHYYQDSSHGQEFTIRLRSGTYVPEFLPAQTEGGNGDASSSHPELDAESESDQSPTPGSEELGRGQQEEGTAPDGVGRRSFPLRLVLASLGLVAVVLLLFWGWRALRIASVKPERSAPIPSVAPSASPAAGPEIRILSGYDKGEYYVDRLGQTWSSDRYFNGGAPIGFPRQVTALATDPTLFETARWGRFTYDIPLSPGSYELRLYFMERLIGPGTVGPGGENSRLFHVLLNGEFALLNFDAYSEAMGNFVAHVRAFRGVTPSSDGFLHMEFRPAREEPFVNAIEIIPTPDGRMPPIRIVAQENSVTDAQGRTWRADRHYRGGVLLRRQVPVRGSEDPDLYSGERYGHFSYVIPVPPGSYGLTLHFAEAYFGTQDQQAATVGSRLFDVYCNGQALLRDFDVFREARGAHRALLRSFHGLRPNPQGQLKLEFVPAKNYAVINAIEVVDESQ